MVRYAVIFILLLCASARADSTLTIGAGTGPECDMTYISAAAATTNYGSEVTAYMCDSCLGSQHILFRWDAIADSLNKGANMYIKACTLFVRQQTICELYQGLFLISPLKVPFVESQATYNIRSTGNNWTTAGAMSPDNDIDTATRGLGAVVSSEGDCLFSTSAHCGIDMTAMAKTMDAGDTALWHNGFIMYGPFSYGGGSTCASAGWAGLDINDWLIHTDDAVTATNRPYIKVVYSAAEEVSVAPRPTIPSVFGPTVTGCDSIMKLSSTRRLGRKMFMINRDSILFLHNVMTGPDGTPANSIRYPRVLKFDGTTWSTDSIISWRFPSTDAVAGQTMWYYGDSGWIASDTTSATLLRSLTQYNKFTKGSTTAITFSGHAGNRTVVQGVGVVGLVDATPDSLINVLRIEGGTTDSTLVVEGTGTTFKKLDYIPAPVATSSMIPMTARNGLLWWDVNDDVFWVSPECGLDTLTTSLFGRTMSYAPTGTSWMSQSIVPTGDSTFAVACQSSSGNLLAMPFRIDRGGGVGAYVTESIADSTILETNANLPAPDVSGAMQGIGWANPTLIRIKGTDTLYCFYWWWAEQSKLPQPHLCYKRSFDKGATWDATRLIALDSNASGMPHTANRGTAGQPNLKFGLSGVPEGIGYGNQHYMWLYWSDSATVYPTGGTVRQDTIRIARLVMQVDTNTFALGRGGVEAVDASLRQGVPSTNYGSSTSLSFGGLRDGGVNGQDILIFRFPGLGANLWGKHVDSATLTLRFGSGSFSDLTGAFYLLRPQGDSVWIESQATWRIRKTITDWADSGASSTTTDIYPTAYNPFTYANIVQNTSCTFVITNLLKAIDGNDTSSIGFVMKQTGGTDEGQMTIASANNSTILNRPQLWVKWQAGVEGGTSARRRRMLGYKESVNAYSFAR